MGCIWEAESVLQVSLLNPETWWRLWSAFSLHLHYWLLLTPSVSVITRLKVSMKCHGTQYSEKEKALIPRSFTHSYLWKCSIRRAFIDEKALLGALIQTLPRISLTYLNAPSVSLSLRRGVAVSPAWFLCGDLAALTGASWHYNWRTHPSLEEHPECGVESSPGG